MRAAKFAISVPAETMAQVDRAAKRLGLTRSRYISVVLAGVAKHERDTAISKRVDEVVTALGEHDEGTLELLRGAAVRAGTEW